MWLLTLDLQPDPQKILCSMKSASKPYILVLDYLVQVNLACMNSCLGGVKALKLMNNIVTRINN